MKIKLSILCCLLATVVLGQDLNTFFNEAKVKGAISIYDYKKQIWIHSNADLAEKGTLPASTFKIIHSLIGLEEGIIDSKNDTIRWDGKPKLFKSFEIPNWNKDNDLEMAFKNSTVWYYEEIAKRIKLCTYRKYLRKNKYSNRGLKNGKGVDFWNYGNLKVTPVEQIELLVKLYKNELSFKNKYQELVKELMLEKETPDYILRSKTGWSYDKMDIGWYIGYIELKNNTLFFATRIEKELKENLKGFSGLRKSITKRIMNELYDVRIE